MDSSRPHNSVAPASSPMVGLGSLIPVGTFEFTVDFNAFNDLVNVIYHDLCHAHAEYSENVSQGMFFYYCGVALWYRLCAIRTGQGSNRSGIFCEMKSKFGSRLILPKAFGQYLDAIGDFQEPNTNIRWTLDPILPERGGHFGKMTKHNFFNYLAYPAPAILSLSLQKEIAVISGNEAKFDAWKLDQIDYEGCPQTAKFTTNVSGYFAVPEVAPSLYKEKFNPKFSEIITELLKSLYTWPEDVDYSEWHFDLHCDLLNYMSELNATLIGKYSMTKYCNESHWGSPLQAGFVEFIDDTDGDTRTVRGFSPFMLPYELSKLISVFRLRILRNEESLDCYPYPFSTAADVPAGWKKNLNSNFYFGDAQYRWNLGVFSTNEMNVDLLITDYVKSFTNVNDS